MSLFKYKNKNPYSNSEEVFSFTIDHISSKDKLFQKYFEYFSFPYFGFNWDALEECLNDLAWTKEKTIVIFHKELPRLSDDEMKTYLDILNDCVDNWSESSYHIFEVFFPENSIIKINSLLHGKVQLTIQQEETLKKESFALQKLVSIIEWSGLKSVNELSLVILNLINENEEWKEYSKFFESLEESANDADLRETLLPSELVTRILDALGMVLFLREETQSISSLSLDNGFTPNGHFSEWAEYFRKNGFDTMYEYSHQDEYIIKASDALLKYGYDIVEKAYERTNASLD